MDWGRTRSGNLNNKQEYGAVIGLITVIATQVLLKLIGVNKISTWIYSTVLILSGVIFSIYAIRSKNNKMGFKLTIASVVIMLFMCIVNVIAVVFIQCYPQQADKYELLTMILVFLSIVSFLAFVIFWIIVAVKLSNKS
ncbi:MAG: hypothetical protein E7211_00200 [Clostridium lundense]|nr:hypothetical protein [Clostridium lundense]